MTSVTPQYKFDIAFSLLHKDLPFAQSIYDELAQYNLKTFLYQHNQKELANNNGISVFSEVFKVSARVVVLFYRKGYGTTYWTKIEHTAIQERFLTEGADFCVLIPIDGEKPIWYPQFMQYIHSGMKPSDIAELILKKLVDRGGELKQKTFEEYLVEARSIRDRKIKHYESLFVDDTYSIVIGEINRVKALLKEKLIQITDQIDFLDIIPTGIPVPNIFKNRLAVGGISIEVNFTPGLHDIKRRGSSQSFAMDITIYSDLSGQRQMEERKNYRINIHPDGKQGWSEITILPEETANYYPKMIDEAGYYYELSEIIHDSEYLINEWFRKFVKKVFEINKV